MKRIEVIFTKDFVKISIPRVIYTDNSEFFKSFIKQFEELK